MDNMDRYIGDVTAGRVAAGRLERLMVERQLRDVETGAARGLVWRPALGRIVVDFCGLLQHSKGEWAGKPLILEPWQEFVVCCLFGWLRQDGTRRFRRAYVEVARKNGKSTLAAALGLYGLLADGEPGAEVYVAGTKREQARIIFAEAQRMARASAALAGTLTVHQHSIFIRDSASRFVPLSADDRQSSGHNTHFAILDELHEHRTDEMYQVMRTSMGARRQPLLISTTTAGSDEQSICGQERDYSEKVLEGSVEADAFFGAIYAIDDEAEWQEEAAWRKANPNLDVSVSREELREMAKEAADRPTALNALLRFRLNVWTSAATRWFRQEDVAACAALAVDEEALAGRRCFGGLDLASIEDVAAWVIVFEPDDPEGGIWQALCRFFVPREAIARRSQKQSVPYDSWARQGHLVATPGEVIDYDWIFRQIDEDAQRYDVVDLAFDRWGASRIYTQLEGQGMAVMQMGQGFASMSAPSKQLEVLVRQHRLAFQNPVMRWMMANAVAVQDPAANIKPDKAKSREKIDGVVAAIMALDRATRHGGQPKSIYDERGLTVL